VEGPVIIATGGCPGGATGTLTVTEQLAVFPSAPVATMLYVVVVCGFTVTGPATVVPLTPAILTLVAFVAV